MKERFKKFKANLKPSVVIGYIIALALGVLATFTIFKITQPEPWRPLGPYPEQKVVAEGNKLVNSVVEENPKIPAVKITEDHIVVTGSKCGKEEVKVSGTYGWRSINPGGFVHNLPKGPPGVRLEGCQSFTFENDIPPEVKEWALKILAKGDQPELYLSGCETPIDEDGNKGEQLCWRTEPFAFKE